MQIGKRVILFQKAATGRSFQFGKYYFTILHWSFWILKPHWPIRTGYSIRLWSGLKVEQPEDE